MGRSDWFQHEHNENIGVLYQALYIKYYAISTNINIQVFDLEGRLIINKNIETWNKNSISISTKNLSSGVYIVSIKNNNTITNRKLIISK